MFLLLISLNGLLRSLHSLAKTVRGMESSLLYYCEILRNLYFCVESALFRHCEKIRKDFRGNPKAIARGVKPLCKPTLLMICKYGLLRSLHSLAKTVRGSGIVIMSSLRDKPKAWRGNPKIKSLDSALFYIESMQRFCCFKK